MSHKGCRVETSIEGLTLHSSMLWFSQVGKMEKKKHNLSCSSSFLFLELFSGGIWNNTLGPVLRGEGFGKAQFFAKIILMLIFLFLEIH